MFCHMYSPAGLWTNSPISMPPSFLGFSSLLTGTTGATSRGLRPSLALNRFVSSMLRLVSDEEMRGGEGAFGGEGTGPDMMGGGGGVAVREVLGGGGVATREILGGGGAGTRMTSSSATEH